MFVYIYLFICICRDVALEKKLEALIKGYIFVCVVYVCVCVCAHTGVSVFI